MISRNIKSKLSAMMFLQFFIWGAWAVTLGTYLGSSLGFEGTQIGLIYGTTALGAIFAPLLVGSIADRFFASQKVFALLHFAGAALLFAASLVISFEALYVVLFAYALCYMPTLALANGIGFRHLDDPEREFPRVRVFGTIGWIVAGLFVGSLGVEDQNIPLRIAASASLLLGVYGLFLPNTPPDTSVRKRTVTEMLGLDAFSLLRDRSFLVLFVCSILVSVPLAFYYNFTNLYLNDIGIQNAAGKMTLGQASEVLFMIVMPLLFRRMGIKWMIAAGMLAWVFRYVLFAFADIDEGQVWMIYLGIVLHGICYDFLFVAGQIYANNRAPDALKNSVQGIMALGTYGVGMFIGSLISGWVVSAYTNSDGQMDWASIWAVPGLMAMVVLVIFLIMFVDNKKNEKGIAMGEES